MGMKWWRKKWHTLRWSEDLMAMVRLGSRAPRTVPLSQWAGDHLCQQAWKLVKYPDSLSEDLYGWSPRSPICNKFLRAFLLWSCGTSLAHIPDPYPCLEKTTATTTTATALIGWVSSGLAVFGIMCGAEGGQSYLRGWRATIWGSWILTGYCVVWICPFHRCPFYRYEHIHFT